MRRLKRFNPQLILSRILNRLISRYNSWFHPIFPRSRCLIIYKDQVLLVKNFTGTGAWSLPGGGVKKGESYQEAAIREVKEELGIELKQAKPLGVFKIPRINHVLVAHTFSARVSNRNLKPSKLELMDAAWFDIHNLPKASPLVAKAVQAYLRKYTSYPQEKLAKRPTTSVK